MYASEKRIESREQIKIQGLKLLFTLFSLFSFFYSSDVQFGQRVALMEIVVKQCGQSLVMGSAAGA